MHKNPITQFKAWYDQIIASGAYKEPTAMTIATASPTGIPDARVVLLKQVDETGFKFVTHYTSSKGQALAKNSAISAVFYWDGSEQQVRIRGHAHPTDRAFSEQYFASRSRDSQLGAWASNQSQVLDNPDALHEAVKDARKRFASQAVPCPEQWGGYCIVPHEIEFWVGQPHRLHDRFLYTRTDSNDWVITRLNP